MGEVLEVGEGVDHIKVGDRVIVPGTSRRVLLLLDRPARPVLGDSTATASAAAADRHNGEPVSAAGNVGGYAEVMNVTATQVFPVATDLPDQWLSLLGAGSPSTLRSNNIACNARVEVAVVGCGHLGLWMVQVARVGEARTIIAST